MTNILLYIKPINIRIDFFNLFVDIAHFNSESHFNLCLEGYDF